MNGKMISSIKRFAAILLAFLFLFSAFSFCVSAEGEKTTASDAVHSVTFMADNAVVDVQKVADGGFLVYLPEPPAHESEVFKGWFTEQGGKLTTDTIITKDLTAYARYTPLRTASFFVNGNLYEQQTFELTGEPYVPTEPLPPAAEGMIFWGWYKDEALTQKASFSSELLRDNAVYYAKFVKESDAVIKITYRIGDQIYEEQRLEKTSGMVNVAAPLSPQSEGQLFGGWYKDEACTVKAAFPQMISADTVFYGKFAEEGKVTFVVEGEVFAEQSFLKDGSTYTIEDPGTPVKNGYMFAGWFQDAEGTKRMSLPAQVTNSQMLYAKFVKIGKVIFMVDGKVYDEQTFADTGNGATVSEPLQPHIDGRVFVGWFRDKNWFQSDDRSSIVSFPTVVSEDATFYAGFETADGTASEEAGEDEPRLTGSVFSGAGIYAIIGGGVILIVAIIILIVRGKKKKQQQ